MQSRQEASSTSKRSFVGSSACLMVAAWLYPSSLHISFSSPSLGHPGQGHSPGGLAPTQQIRATSGSLS
eukprot:8654457-Pyramimonas_sp.AAC.1